MLPKLIRIMLILKSVDFLLLPKFGSAPECDAVISENLRRVMKPKEKQMNKGTLTI